MSDGDGSATIHRGNCYSCGQQWVLGHVDSERGLYGRFFCCACRDIGLEEDYDEESTIAAGVAPSKRHCDDSAGGTSKYRKILVGVPPRRRHVLVECDTSRFRSCGAGVWLCALVLVAFVEKSLFRERSEGPKGLRILELGAGCGVPGIALAQLGAEVVLTDVADLCPLLQSHAEANVDGCLRPSVIPLSFGSSLDLQRLFNLPQASEGFDLIVGSDIGYAAGVHSELFDTLDALLAFQRSAPEDGTSGSKVTIKRNSRIVFVLPQRPDEFEAFSAFAEGRGWALEILEQVDLEAERGDPTSSNVAIVELQRRSVMLAVSQGGAASRVRGSMAIPPAGLIH